MNLSVILAILSACTPSVSDEARDIDATLVPSIVAWSKTGGVFDLQANLTSKYDAVCFVPEYNCVSGTSSGVIADEVYSTFGGCVPENKSALVLVARDKAHAALIDSTIVRIDGPSQQKCVSASSVILRSRGSEAGEPAVVSLEQR
jgi:hypothetical protein